MLYAGTATLAVVVVGSAVWGALVVLISLALLPSAHRLERPVPASPPEPVVPDVREAVPSSGELVG